MLLSRLTLVQAHDNHISNMNISFESKVARVTGAGSGLGLATAKAFAESGASVVLADWNEQAVRSAAEELAAQGHKALAIRCDVADDAQVAAMVEQTVSAFGRLDAAFNNAGVQCAAAEIADASSEEFDRVIAINLRGVWNCMKYELRQMRKQGSGAIVNCSSFGKPRMASNPATQRSSRERSSPSRARSRRRAGLSPAPTLLPPRSRRSPT
jgi:NAD(P)-dependent dehydrogenase (short-subunit alcohol dehydrogenase family)